MHVYVQMYTYMRTAQVLHTNDLLHVGTPFVQDFKTVMSALKSNNERWGIMNVTLVLRQPCNPEESTLCQRTAS